MRLQSNASRDFWTKWNDEKSVNAFGVNEMNCAQSVCHSWCIGCRKQQAALIFLDGISLEISASSNRISKCGRFYTKFPPQRNGYFWYFREYWSNCIWCQSISHRRNLTQGNLERMVCVRVCVCVWTETDGQMAPSTCAKSNQHYYCLFSIKLNFRFLFSRFAELWEWRLGPAWT